MSKKKAYTAENAPSPDLIVFDINISDKNSCDALDKIKEDPVLKQKTIFMVTKKSSHNDIKASFDLGATISRTKSWSNEGSRYIDFFQNILALS